MGSTMLSLRRLSVGRKPNLLVGSYPHTQAALDSAQADGDGTNREGSSRNVTILDSDFFPVKHDPIQ